MADLSRMRREARKVAEASSTEVQGQSPRSSSSEDLQSSALREQEARQSKQDDIAQKPHVEEAKSVENKEQTGSIQSNLRSNASNDSKREIVPERKPSEVEEQKKVGRPKGIRSNPDYESTTIRLHKQVKAKARYILSTQPEKMDLQTLLNNLLEDFVREQDV